MAQDSIPALGYLGRTLNQLLPLDPGNLSGSLKKGGNHQAISFDDETTLEEVSSQSVNLPKNVTIRQVGRTQGGLQVFNSGRDVTKKLETDVNFAMSYMAISSSASTSTSSSSAFKEDSHYALYNDSQYAYNAMLTGNTDLANHLVPEITEEAIALPEWNDIDPQTYDAYDEFFRTWGTHVIIGAVNGCRYQLQIAQNSSADDNVASFDAHVKAEYNGILSKGSFDAGVKSTKEYKTYESSHEVNFFLIGGGRPEQLDLISTNIDDAAEYKKAYSAWAKSMSPERSDVLNVDIQELGEIFEYSQHPDIKSAGKRLKDALRAFNTRFEASSWLTIKKQEPLHGTLSFTILDSNREQRQMAIWKRWTFNSTLDYKSGDDFKTLIKISTKQGIGAVRVMGWCKGTMSFILSATVSDPQTDPDMMCFIGFRRPNDPDGTYRNVYNGKPGQTVKWDEEGIMDGLPRGLSGNLPWLKDSSWTEA